MMQSSNSAPESGEKQSLAVIPGEGNVFFDEPRFVFPGGSAELQIAYVRDGKDTYGGLKFDTVRAFRYRAEGHSTAWHFRDAYNTLAEVVDSEWVRELVLVQPPDRRGLWEIHHFIIYLEDTGSFEIAAESWSWLPETLA